MDVRMAADGTNRAMTVLRARRLVARRRGAWALSAGGLDALRRRRTGSDHPVTSPRERSDLVYDRDWDEEERLAEWQDVVKETDMLPTLVAAAIAFDAWCRLAPLQHAGWIGSLLVSALLQTRGKTRHHVASLNVGMRAASYRRAHVQDLGTRCAGFLDGVAAAADRGHKDLDRLTLAREVLGVQRNGRRSTSRLPALVDLLLSKPLISVPLAAKELKVSPQAVEGMIGELGATPREWTVSGLGHRLGLGCFPATMVTITAVVTPAACAPAHSSTPCRLLPCERNGGLSPSNRWRTSHAPPLPSRRQGPAPPAWPRRCSRRERRRPPRSARPLRPVRSCHPDRA